MSDLNKMQFVQFGLHSSVTDFSTLPTFESLNALDAEILPRDRDRFERDFHRDDNMSYPDGLGVVSLEDLAFALLVRGMVGNVGAAIDADATTEVAPVLDSLLGVAGTDPAGAATTVTGDTGASALLNVTSDANVVAGGGVLFQTPTEWLAREVLSKAANVLTLDRGWTDGAPGADTVLYRSVNWPVPFGTNMHTHAAIRGKGQNWERTYVGCSGAGKLLFPEKLPVRLETQWRPTNWTDTTVGPSFVEPTAGRHVMNVNSRLYIGSDAVLFKGGSLDLGLTKQPRECGNGPAGELGSIVVRKQPVLECMLYFGVAGLTFGEIADSSGNISLNKIQGLTSSAGAAHNVGDVESTYDIALQVGAVPEGCMYIRMPAATFRGKLVQENGVEMCRAQIRPRRPSAGSPMRIHLF